MSQNQISSKKRSQAITPSDNLEKYISMTGVTDVHLSQELGMSPSTVGAWRKKGTVPVNINSLIIYMIKELEEQQPKLHTITVSGEKESIELIENLGLRLELEVTRTEETFELEQ